MLASAYSIDRCEFQLGYAAEKTQTGILGSLKKLAVFSLMFMGVLSGNLVLAQTYPAAQSLPVSQSFSSLTPATVTTYPTGFQGWTIGTASSTSFRTTDPTADRALIASGTAASNSGNVYNYLDKIGFLNTGSLDLSICFAINTTGKTNISVQYDAMNIRNPYDGTTNTRINEMVLQYKVGSGAGSWTTLSSTAYSNISTLQTSGTTGQNVTNKSATLPAACENQAAVYLRWVSRDVSGAGARPSFAIDNVNVTGTTAAPPLSASSTTGTISCFGGSTNISVSATGGTAPYTGTGTFSVTAGSYTYTVTDNNGATATTSITVTQPAAITSTTSVSALAPYVWNGTSYSTSGTYTYSTTASNGCDSTATLVLTITTPSCVPTFSTTSQSACGSYSWNGNSYTSSGSYTFVTTNAGGCDSTATLNLTINNGSSNTSSATACASYTWNGSTYTTSGTYTYSYTNGAGCPSLDTLLLTINNNTSSTTNVTTCGTYSWNGNSYSTSGTYTYTTTNAAGCDSTATLNLTITTFSSSVNVFSENMGVVGSTTAISTHETNNGFENDGYTMSGTADIRATSISNTYAGASGGANVFFTTNGTASFQISGINTVGITNLVLSFGNLKSTTLSNGSELVVETSTDGVNYTALSMSPMATGTGTTGWQYRSSTGSIPNNANLTIRWRTTSTSIQFRIDDVKLSGLTPGSASISASGATTFCPGGVVTLTCSGAASYLWSSGETTQSISVSTSGSYSCVATDVNGCTSASNAVSVDASDITPPTVICQNITVPLDANGEAFITSAQIDNGSSDNCGIATISISNDYFTGLDLGPNNVDLTITDNYGNSSTCTAVVTIIDGVGPTMSCNNLTVYLDANGQASITTAQVDNGSFDNDGIDTLYISRSAITCADIAVAGALAPTDLIISEYVEGATTNKCIELYNGTSNPIDLTANAYQLRFYFNGGTTASTPINLSGTVAPGSTFVICSSASAANVLALANQTSAAVFYNGDDAIELSKNFGLNVVDIFGRIGEDPGNGWGVAPLATNDQTLRRRSTATQGITTNPASGFATLNSEWNAYAADDISGLGSHFVNGTSGGTTVVLTGIDPSGNVGTCISNVTVLDTLSPTVTCKNVTLYLNGSGNATLVPAQIDNGSSDNCGIASMNVSTSNFTCSNIGANTVTLTVSDVYGNSASCNATVTVLDTLPPAAGFQNVTIYLDANGDANLTAAQVNNGSIDNCGSPTISVTPTAYDCGDLGTVVAPTDLIISEHVEGSGNNKCIELYNGTSNAINLATGGYQLRVYFNGATTFTSISLTGTVASGGTYLICNNTATSAFLSLANQTSSSMTFNGDDALVLFKTSGNQIVDIFGRIGEDPGAAWGTAPLTTVDQTLRRKSTITSGVTSNPASGFPTLSSQWTAAGLDNTSNLGSHFMVIGNNTAQFTVTDAGGSTLTVPVGVTVKDTIKPVATCQNITVSLNSSGTASITAAQINNGSTDNCGIATISVSPTSFNCANVGSNTVTLTVTDLGGNTSTCTATVTIVDNTNPSITAPASVSASTNTGCTATGVALGSATTADNCSVVSVTNNAPSAFPLGNTTVTWTVTDGSGNTATATQVVTVTDNVNPTITAPSNKNVTTNSGCTATGVVLGTPTSADNCSVASVTNNAPSAFPLGNTTITWTVTDGSGNTATATQTVTVTDNVNPTITAPSAVSANTNSSCTATGVASGTPTTADNCSVGSVTNNAPTAFLLGATTVTWTVTDGSGNTATATQTVTVTDNVNPTITAPAAVSATTNTGCTATGVSLGSATTADNCSVASVTNNAPTAFPLGATTVTWTVTDGSGNTATATQVVTITDNVNPTITAPAAVSATTNTGCTATGVSLGSATTADNCSVASVTNNAPTAFPLGNTTVTWTVTDGSGNTATATQVVTVTDNINPTITAPAAVSANTNTGCTATGVVLGTPTTADNCSVASVTNNAPAAFPVGSTTVTWTVTDGSGNNATATQIVTVTDNIAPTAVCQNISVNLNASGNASITASQVNNGSSDNCGISTVTVSQTSFTCAHVGANTVTLTVTDVNGNVSTCNATVTVVDNIAPTANCQNISVNLNASGNASITAAQINNGSFDNCGIANVSLSKTSFNCSDVGVNTITMTVTDVNGNSSNCNATVTVIDNIAPVISCPGNISQNNTLGSCGAIISFITPVGTDICGATTVQTAGLPSGSLFPVGTTVNTFTVTDPSGNQSSCSFSVTITDTQAPVFSNVPANISSCNPVTWSAPTVTDNCAGVITTSTHVPGTNFPVGTTTVTYTATDVYGLISTASFTVTVLEPSVAAISITSNRDFNNICVGENITLTINGGTLGAGAAWRWYTGSCGSTLLSTFNGQTSITVSPTATTTYFARAEGQCNSTGCVSLTVNVSTGGPGTAPVFSTLPTAAAPGVNSTVCVNPVPGATFYQWFTQNGHNQSILFNGQVGPVQTSTNCVNVSFVLPQQNYFIRVFAGNACGRTSQTNAAGIRGSVAASTCINGPTQVCPGQSVNYTACAITNQTSVSYAWQIIPAVPGTATITFNGTNATVNYLPGFTTAQICVNGVSSFGLAGPSYCINVSTNAPTPGAITGLTTPCEGSSQTYSIAAVPNATSYTWSSNITGAVVVGNGTSATVTFPANVFAGDVCVVANSSCGVSAPACLAVTSGQPGVPGPIAGPVSGICNASNVNYALGTSDANTYTWSLPAGVTISGPSNLNAVNLNFGAGFAGTGTITVTAFYDCGSATSSINVDGAPDAPSLTPAVICPEASELYTASSTGATSYNWTLSGDDYSACTNPPTCSQYFVIWSVSGGSLSVTASNSCGTSPATAISGSSCRTEMGGLDTKVYPNPTNGLLYVEFRAQVAGEHQITVTDISGRVMFSKAIDANAGANLQEIDLSGANAGMYVVYVKDPKGAITVNKVGLE